MPLASGVATLLRACGAVVAGAGSATLIAASRATLERACAAARCESERAAVRALIAAFQRARSSPPALRWRGRSIALDDGAQVMGIVNVTPDSFYERVGGAEAALAKGRAIVADGGAIVDVGGQSYADGVRRVGPEDEAARVVPAVRALAAACDAAISADTVHARVAHAVLRAGAHAINDCSGLSDPALADAVAEHGAGLVIVHLKGRLNHREPATYVYDDALAEIVEFLHERAERALRAGVARDAIAIDPGLEFGKEPATDLEILARFGELRALGYPIVLAASRKSFIGRVVGRPAAELLVPSLAAAAAGIAAGARIVRAHDVAETVQLARMLAAIERAGMPAEDGASNSCAAEAV
ncbi:MAG TPA: dihydropteroate synthase [Candidatus Baltobacteraceae bacterium]|nr:dihydropteroate synthase [Candidatus Baltobacteraceae bacterium]